MKLNATARRMQAAKVAALCSTIRTEDKMECWNQLAEIHVARPWLRQALALRMFAEQWNMATAAERAGRLKDVPEPPSWADQEEIAASIVAGTFRPADVARMAKVAADASAAIDRAAFHSSEYQEQLVDQLEDERPATLSAVQAICDAVTGAQADARRKAEREEQAARRSAQAARERAARRAAMLRKAVTLK